MEVNQTLVRSYSQALFDAVLKAGILEETAAQAKQLVDVVQAAPQLRTFMESPQIPSDRKEALVQKVFGGRINPLLLNFCRMLIRRNRLELFGASLKAFHRLHEKHLGITAAIVTSAVPLTEDEMKRMQVVLDKYTGLNLVIEFRVDPSILGGVWFLCGDLLLETTLVGKLQRLKHDLLKSKVY